MQRNRRPLNPEHQQTHLPMGGMIRSRMKRLFAILGTLLLVQVLIIWAVEDLELFEAAWLTMTTLVTVGYGDYAVAEAGNHGFPGNGCGSPLVFAAGAVRSP